MKLYDYYRSTASYRVRIALNFKNISYETFSVHLVNNGVPTLNANGHLLSQSLAIIEYLEEINPDPPLFPHDPLGREHIRSLALMIACDMHPLNNLRVLQQLKQQFKATELQINEWYHHWLKEGFDAIETKLKNLPRKNHVCYGQDISLADIFLIPQVYNAKRFNFPMNDYPLINKINDYCLTIDSFIAAAPEIVSNV